MDLYRMTAAIMTLGFVLTTHLAGFNNVKVLGTFWIPELMLIAYVLYSLIPFEQLPQWFKRLKNSFHRKQKGQKVVKLKAKKRKKLSLSLKKLSLPTVLDALLITAVAALSLLVLYRI